MRRRPVTDVLEILPPAGPPRIGPILVTEAGAAIVPHPSGNYGAAPIFEGLRLAWEAIDADGVMLVHFHGPEANSFQATTLSLAGLAAYIADLQAIAREMDRG